MRGKEILMKSLLSVVLTISIVFGSILIQKTTVNAQLNETNQEKVPVTGTIDITDMRNPNHKTTIDLENGGKPVLLFFGDPVSCPNSILTLENINHIYEKYVDDDNLKVCIYEIKDKTDEELLESCSKVPEDFYINKLDNGYYSAERRIYSKVFNLVSGENSSIMMPLIAYCDGKGNIVQYSEAVSPEPYIMAGLSKAGVKMKKANLPIAVLEGTKQYTNAVEFLDAINKVRISNGHAPLTISSDYTEAAMQRAYEIVLYRSLDFRPDYTLIQNLNADIEAELIAYIETDIDTIISKWMRSQEDYEILMSDSYKSAGVGIVEIDGKMFWTVELSNKTTSNTTIPNKDESYTAKVGFLDINTVAFPWSVNTYYVGEESNMGLSSRIYYNGSEYSVKLSGIENVDCTISDPEAIEYDISTGILKAKKVTDSFSITLTADNGLECILKGTIEKNPFISDSPTNPVNPGVTPSNPSTDYTTIWVEATYNGDVAEYENSSMILLSVSPAIKFGKFASYKDGELVWESGYYDELYYGTCSTFEMLDDYYGEYYLEEGLYEIKFFNLSGQVIASDSVYVKNIADENIPTDTPTQTPSKTPTATPTEQDKPTNPTNPTNKPTSAPIEKPTIAPTEQVKPTSKPTSAPVQVITTSPTTKPTAKPTAKPTVVPDKNSDKTGTVEDFAERLYTTCLGRDAEEAGKAYWTSELKGGKTGAEVAEGFFFSPEYEDRKLNNKDFIGTLYETFMGRTPADGEVAYWNSEMDNGKTRKDIFDGFVNSLEWANICLTYGIRSGGLASPTFEKEASSAVKAFAERLYTTCLGRKAEKEGLEWWAAELANLRQTGTVAAQGFFFSPEFIGLKTNNDEYVTRLYRTFMGREPEEAGFKFWTDELKSGKDRQYVFDGFSSAPEFADLCAEAGIMR